MPYPLLAAASLRADVPWSVTAWLPVFLSALADEAEDGLQLLATLERAWFEARRKAAGQRRTSRAGLAIDIMAAAPLVSATSLGKALGMAVNNAAALLDRFCLEGIAIEVSHRAKRRLFGLAALAPLRDGAAPPRRPDPSRGRGRPRHLAVAPGIPDPLPPPAPLSPRERRGIDYSGLEAAMSFADAAMGNAKRLFASLHDHAADDQRPDPARTAPRPMAGAARFRQAMRTHPTPPTTSRPERARPKADVTGPMHNAGHPWPLCRTGEAETVPAGSGTVRCSDAAGGAPTNTPAPRAMRSST